MIVVVKMNVYGHESGGTLSAVYGPFPSHKAADDFRKSKEHDDYGVEYWVQTVVAPDA